jgi:hypothetical protein
MRLYMLFGDEQFRVQADEALNALKDIVMRAERHRSIVWKVMSETMHAY